MVFAIAKSADSSQGMLLLTGMGEIGVWTNGKFFGAPFPWLDQLTDGIVIPLLEGWTSGFCSI